MTLGHQLTFGGQIDTGIVSTRPCESNEVGFMPAAVLDEDVISCSNPNLG